MWTVTEKLKFLQRRFGESSLSRNGEDVAFKCPNTECQSRFKKGKKKLVINLKTDLYHCWVCGIKGKSILLLLKMYCDKESSAEYLEKFKNEQSLGLENDSDVINQISLPIDFRLLYYDLDSSNPDTKALLNYLLSRNLSKRDLLYFKLGSSSKSQFRRRVIIPSFNDCGKLNYYVARSIDENRGKYFNADCDKTSIIFNEINIDWSRELTIVEGPFDLFKTNENSTCLLGSSLSERSLLFKKIVENNTPIILSLDKDAQKKSLNIAKLLMSYAIPVKMLTIEGHEDVGSMSKEEFVHEKNESSLIWTKNKDILSRIRQIKSGSLL